jgi:hypothetical protein
MLLEARRRIRRQTVASLTRFRGLPRWAIENRLAKLDREWSRGRDVKTGAACAALAGLALATLLDTRWMLLPAAAVAAALWLRHSGLRARFEIEAERRVLHAMRRTAA